MPALVRCGGPAHPRKRGRDAAHLRRHWPRKRPRWWATPFFLARRRRAVPRRGVCARTRAETVARGASVEKSRPSVARRVVESTRHASGARGQGQARARARTSARTRRGARVPRPRAAHACADARRPRAAHACADARTRGEARRSGEKGERSGRNDWRGEKQRRRRGASERGERRAREKRRVEGEGEGAKEKRRGDKYLFNYAERRTLTHEIGSRRSSVAGGEPARPRGCSSMPPKVGDIIAFASKASGGAPKEPPAPKVTLTPRGARGSEPTPGSAPERRILPLRAKSSAPPPLCARGGEPSKVLALPRDVRPPKTGFRAYAERDDVGCFGVLSGNWGNCRQDRAAALWIEQDMARSPATLLFLQAAHPGAVMALTGGLTLTHGPGARGSEPKAFERKPEGYFLVCKGEETCDTLVVAARRSMCEGLDPLSWGRIHDGSYHPIGMSRPHDAISRVLVCNAVFRRPLCGHNEMVVANVHMHAETAAQRPGLEVGWRAFWRHLASRVLDLKVRILAGDFGKSVFCVPMMLRDEGLEVTLAAFTVFKDVRSIKLDTCAVYLIGPAISIRRLYSHFSLVEPDKLEDVPGGQGYGIDSFLPKRASHEGFRRALAPTVMGQKRCTQGWRPLPAFQQKSVDPTIFDPRRIFCKTGAHIPLLGFFGSKSYRSEAAMDKRQANKRAKRKAKQQERRGRLV